MAFRHVVVWRIGIDDIVLREQAVRGLAGRLEALVGVVPGLISATASPNTVPVEGNWDMALVADFVDEEALSKYNVDPDHLEVAKDIRAIATARASADFPI
ncbi:MAG: Dabb family protein [Scrofimicrobium sp.]